MIWQLQFYKYMFKNLLKWYTPHFERFVQNVIAMRFAIIHEHKYIKTRYVPYIKIAFVSISFDADAVKLSLILFLHHLHKLPTPFHTRRWTCVYVLNGQCRTYHINAKFSKKSWPMPLLLLLRKDEFNDRIVPIRPILFVVLGWPAISRLFTHMPEV